MKKLIRKALSGLLALVLLASLLCVCPLSPAEALSSSAEPAADIQSGLTLHCWNWSFKEIESKLDLIAKLGYTSIQTSPIQQAKQATDGFPSNDWWVYYQPASFAIDDTGLSALGTKADFESMCKAAHELGIKVIVDVVANHMGNTETGTNGLAASIVSDIREDADCWHDVTKNTNDYSSRLEVTQYCMAGLPDLNTSNPKIQTYVLNYLKECIDAGADGFRFDAAKHIETPDDGTLASDFWPTVIDGAKDYAKSSRNIDLYCYGELLDSVGGSVSVNSYTKYMNITDNNWSDSLLRNVVVGGNASSFSSHYIKTADASQLVLWAESHDTFADGTTYDVTDAQINKAWALVAARSDAMSLYLARPANMSQLLGAGSVTAWSYPEVAAVNLFHNRFVGEGEYVASEGSIAYVERGNAGVVLVNCKGGEASVSVTANAMSDGTYTDQLTGNTFTVADGKISGEIGSTGIAVVYEADPCYHVEHDADGLCNQCRANVGHTYDDSGLCACGDTLIPTRTVYFINSFKWDTVNVYSWYDDINIITSAWPGNAMTHEGGLVYSCTVPADAPNIIFNNGTDQTDDLSLPEESTGLDTFNMLKLQWTTFSEDLLNSGNNSTDSTEPSADSTSGTETTAPDDTQDKDNTAADNGTDPTIIIAIAAGVVAIGILIALIICKRKGVL